MFGTPTRRVRIVVQAAVFCLWVSLILATRNPMDAWIARTLPVSLMLRIDPLVMTVVCGGMRMAVTITLLGFVTLAVSLALGRVFCGWVCPLGATFDAYGWFLKRLRVPFEGPSPSWFRAKYYLLLAILIFAVIGGVSPLMGFDPIVLITRTAAVVINPFLRKGAEIGFGAEMLTGKHGWFVDGATLALFLAIMTGTTKLSRIWCRAACPLGAYLALLSRNSILRRDTRGCVHCNICSNHCPTGAIDFKNAEIYNESECIKCFSCSQECPVDANFFTIKTPFPAFSKSQFPVSLERRQVLATTAAVAVAAPALQLAAGEPLSSKKLIRPPMSREERDFLASCIRCGECMKACPSGILKPAGLEHGIRALWSPVMVATEGACVKGCNACSQACPTDAIMKYPIEKKYAFKAGTAVFDSSRCISHTENKFCSECVRACPVDAIAFVDGWTPEGGVRHGVATEQPAPDGQTPARPVKVIYDKCIGCGGCEFACNHIVMGQPAMTTTSFGRAKPSSVPLTVLLVGLLAGAAWTSTPAQAGLTITRTIERDYEQIKNNAESAPAPAPSSPLTNTAQPPSGGDSGAVDLSALDSGAPPSGGPPPGTPGGPAASQYTLPGGMALPVFKVYFDFLFYLRPNKGNLSFDSFHNLLLFELMPDPKVQFSFEVRQSPRYYELDYNVSEKFKIRFGKIWIPFDDMSPHNIFGGRINTSQLSPGNATFLPDLWAELGVGLKYTLIDTKALKFDADGYIVNGFRDGGTDPTGNNESYPSFGTPGTAADNNRDKAFGGRLHATIARNFGLGTSFYTGRYNSQNESKEKRITAIGFDAQARFGPIETRAGLATMMVDAETTTYNRGGLYGEVAYKFGAEKRWKLLARGGTVQLDDRVLDVTDEQIIGGEIAYRLGFIELSFEHSRDLLIRTRKDNYTFTAFRVVVAL
ncbi:MAG TPA: 4Fe-4S binding protein [Bdellovibrionota bacterium]|nr:4Fe-4S binding protein [Bdellovibrionota bacterium]